MVACRSIYRWNCHAILHLLYSRFLYELFISLNNKDTNLKEPFEGLFTQGMVCHETYKDKNNKWLYPNEIEKIHQVNFLKNKDKSQVTVGSPEAMSKSKKNVVDPEEMIKVTEQTRFGGLYCLIVHQKKKYFGQIMA